jgi:hypothetical protein
VPTSRKKIANDFRIISYTRSDTKVDKEILLNIVFPSKFQTRLISFETQLDIKKMGKAKNILSQIFIILFSIEFFMAFSIFS